MQVSTDVLPRFRNKCQDRLIAELAFVLRVIALARAHLFAVHRLHGRVRIQGHGLQFHIRSFPHPLPKDLLDFQNLAGHMHIQTIQKAPQRRLRWQLLDPQNSCQHGIACDEPQLIQSLKPNIETHHDAQDELI